MLLARGSVYLFIDDAEIPLTPHFRIVEVPCWPVSRPFASG
ncbi:MAG TPA: hypothetical protein VH704_02310 [Casimicrobiaceae bacterium]|jgi:hypothetical protein|nr:hypothetical protein [Casimicrobiaceae bacterium]